MVSEPLFSSFTQKKPVFFFFTLRKTTCLAGGKKNIHFPVSVVETLQNRDTENILDGLRDTLEGVLSYILVRASEQEQIVCEILGRKQREEAGKGSRECGRAVAEAYRCDRLF